MVDAIRASLRLLEAAEDRVTFPLYCAVLRAPLGSSDFGVHLAGATGIGKTELAALCQQHYGAGMDARHLPGSWLSTDNALEILAFLTKDTLMTVDDFSPGGDHHKIQALHARADRLFRAQGNAAGRGRLRSDGTLRPTRPPRGLVLSTGEDVPRGQSLRARVLVLEVPGQGAGAVDWDKLTFCQADAAAGLYAQAMAGFVRWLAPQYRDVGQRLKEEIASLRAEACQSGQHPRTPDIVASLAVGLHYFLVFAQEVGALDEDEAATLWRRGWQALVGATESQKEHQASSEPTRCFLELL
ncbi:MAG TPA: DUF927 domain-containing protein, partial [Dehalococcoidia bacterium]|nr:DUF927 domain-containing protein [Dehalococcoidia bacterium]